ncbi:MAG: sulfite exporter TauE/SafE family protein [Thermoanaerobaculia bacterium]
MTFLVSQAHIAPHWLVLVGFVVGILGGFFGVGGSFLAGPALYALGLPMNYVVGTDIAHIVGKSVVAAKKHRALGNVDIKLGLVMAFGTIPGVELGARLVQRLKTTHHADVILGLSFSFVLLAVSCFVFWESLGALRLKKKSAKSDRLHFNSAWKWIHTIRVPPIVRLPISGVEISLWAILAVALTGGFFSGFLGGGAGYIRMPMFVYILGIPTHVAIGTDLFEIILSAGYGTVSHALKGNVDILIALIMHTGAALGAQIGAQATERFQGPRIRFAFAPLPLLGAAALLFELHRRGFL